MEINKDNSIRVLLDNIDHEDSSYAIKEHCFTGLDQAEFSNFKDKDAHLYSGKVRDCLVTDKDYTMIHSDRLSAFDRIVAHVPFKGMYLTAINEFWLKKAAEHVSVCPFTKVDSRTLKMKKLTPFKVEVIVRGYLAGSMKRSYEKGEREFCGQVLAERIPSFGKLPSPIITPTTKAEALAHDENITPKEVIANNLCNEEQWTTICDTALKLFSLGTDIFAQKGWILVDTKYEFGFDEAGKIYVMDEVHTPDSSRLWLKATYEDKLKNKHSPDMFDKEIIRDYLIQQDFMGKGPIPKIPVHKITELSRVYLNVTEALLEQPLRYEEPADYKKLI